MLILILLEMISSIHFNYQFVCMAIKISYKVANGMLPSNFKPI